MGWLREQLAGYRDERRKGRERMDAEGLPRPRWYDKLLIRATFVLGVYLLVWGDTVERVFGAGMAVPPAALWTWALVKVLHEGKWRDSE